MNSLSTNVLEKVDYLNSLANQSFLALAVCLVEVKENKLYESLDYKTFSQYYRNHLGREKETVSKLIRCGEWIREKGVIKETTEDKELKYSSLYRAIIAYPDSEPQLVLAAAKTNTLSELHEENTERVFGKDHEHKPENDQRYYKCECGKFCLV